MANSGHIIVQPDGSDRYDRQIRHAIEETRLAIRDATPQLPTFNKGEGLYEIEAPSAPKRMALPDLLTLARRYELHGVRVRTSVTDDAVQVVVSRWKTGMVSEAQFSREYMPTEGQARATLDSAALACKC